LHSRESFAALCLLTMVQACNMSFDHDDRRMIARNRVKHGWQVRVQIKGSKARTKFFADRINGGIDKALSNAVKWRDEILAQTSFHQGEQQSKDMRGIYPNRLGYIVVVSISGRRFQRYFSSSTSDTDEAALASARSWRDYMKTLTVREAMDEMDRYDADRGIGKYAAASMDPPKGKFVVDRIPAETRPPVDRGLENITRNVTDKTHVVSVDAPGNRRVIAVVHDDDYPTAHEAKWAAIVIREALHKHYMKATVPLKIPYIEVGL